MPVNDTHHEDGDPVSTTPAAALDTERADLLDALAAARAALITTVQGLSDQQLAERPTASALCLGGIVKHVTSAEEEWMNFVLHGPSALRYELPEGVTWDDVAAGTAREFPQWMIDHQNDFQWSPQDTLAGILTRYEQVAARTEEIINGVPDLSTAHPLPEAPWHQPGTVHSIRRVVAHVIIETAQHAGHADILRETLDGQTSS
ncbi:DinB family protein [Actinoalloteichus caeruleus]|uniref:DinB family protein n=1 Tax=Actinoalloteichus TaxID=65496 RepID=UPI003556E92C